MSKDILDELSNAYSFLRDPWIGKGIDEIARLRRLLEGRWQPIETAPKDGTRILACWADDQNCTIIEWWDFAEFWYQRFPGLAGVLANGPGRVLLPRVFHLLCVAADAHLFI